MPRGRQRLAEEVLAVGNLKETPRKSQAVHDEHDRPHRNDGRRAGPDALPDRCTSEGQDRHQDDDVTQRRRPAAMPLLARHEIQQIQHRRADAEAKGVRSFAPPGEGENADQVDRRLKGNPGGTVEHQPEETACDRRRRAGNQLPPAVHIRFPDKQQGNDDDRERNDCLLAGPQSSSKKHNGDEQEAELQQYQSKKRGEPSQRPSLSHPAQRFDEEEGGRHLRPDADGVKKNRRPKRDERKNSARCGVVDAFIFEQTNRRTGQERAEECHRH